MKAIKLDESQLRQLLGLLVNEAKKKKTKTKKKSKKPMKEAGRDALGYNIPEDSEDFGHPLASDDNGISPTASKLIEQLAKQVANDMADGAAMGGTGPNATDEIDPDDLFPELFTALNECIVGFMDGFEL